jgi:hypothetical protein
MVTLAGWWTIHPMLFGVDVQVGDGQVLVALVVPSEVAEALGLAALIRGVLEVHPVQVGILVLEVLPRRPLIQEARNELVLEGEDVYVLPSTGLIHE